MTCKPLGASRRLDTRAPSSLHVLGRIFSALEFGLGALMLYQHTPDFAAVKRAIESSCQLSFTSEHLQQIMHLLPGAYALKWKRNTRTARRQVQERDGDRFYAQQPPVLTIRKQKLPSPNENCESLEARITLFFCKANEYVERHVETMKKNCPDITVEEINRTLKLMKIERAPLPKVPQEIARKGISPVSLRTTICNERADDATSNYTQEKFEEALAKPVPQNLKSLPDWLINKVRKQEICRKVVIEKNAEALKKRMLSTLPQLSDQLQSLVIVTKKSVFSKAEVVRRLAIRAPIKGRIEEQLYLLESLVPEWLTVILGDGKEYIKISTSLKYNVVKASLRRAVSVEI
ncbi:DNA replication factor [Plasmopara halstedii]|uniref:DNA replication factor n=1 Tax=Plasmopara halstedii TaxID=4781 RepID=A0A0P1B376_PLAHL|nr:DNA replication factor [Plasmopara halstedii]CEG47919.1 DNA replication factor [Plasmopara halstedii]|eukprot:XP_024584288.1 DNA replication factor [Plasmopara halstedii]